MLTAMILRSVPLGSAFPGSPDSTTPRVVDRLRIQPGRGATTTSAISASHAAFARHAARCWYAAPAPELGRQRSACRRRPRSVEYRASRLGHEQARASAAPPRPLRRRAVRRSPTLLNWSMNGSSFDQLLTCWVRDTPTASVAEAIPTPAHALWVFYADEGGWRRSATPSTSRRAEAGYAATSPPGPDQWIVYSRIRTRPTRRVVSASDVLMRFPATGFEGRRQSAAPGRK